MWEALPSASGGSATGSTRAAGSASPLHHHLLISHLSIISSSRSPPYYYYHILIIRLVCSPLSQTTMVSQVNTSAVNPGNKASSKMQEYAAVYASSMGVMLLLKIIRGVAFVKVRDTLDPTQMIKHSLILLTSRERVNDMPDCMEAFGKLEGCFLYPLTHCTGFSVSGVDSHLVAGNSSCLL